jgi:hypothetical protein
MTICHPHHNPLMISTLCGGNINKHLTPLYKPLITSPLYRGMTPLVKGNIKTTLTSLYKPLIINPLKTHNIMLITQHPGY